jgi:hypothetical protein
MVVRGPVAARYDRFKELSFELRSFEVWSFEIQSVCRHKGPDLQYFGDGKFRHPHRSEKSVINIRSGGRLIDTWTKEFSVTHIHKFRACASRLVFCNSDIELNIFSTYIYVLLNSCQAIRELR